jgi:hypothetical protein
MSAHKDIYASLSQSLLEEVVNSSSEPTSERTVDILTTLQTESTKKSKQPITIATLESTKIGKVLTKTIKTCKRHKRTAIDTDKEQWDNAISIAEILLSSYKQAAELESKLVESGCLLNHSLLYVSLRNTTNILDLCIDNFTTSFICVLSSFSLCHSFRLSWTLLSSSFLQPPSHSSSFLSYPTDAMNHIVLLENGLLHPPRV